MTTQMIRLTTLMAMVFAMAATALAQGTPPPTPQSEYRIGANDVLTITVWNEKDLSGDVVVRADGKIALKVGNDITALGLRPDELRTKVMEELSRFFKPVPQVVVQVKQMNSHMAAFTMTIPPKPGSAAAAVATARPPMLEVSGPTYFADGEVKGASAGWTLKLNEPIEMYQVSGKTLCASASATMGKPTDAGSGWRLTITPLKLGTELVLGVSWQRLWERGETLTNGPKGSAVITLQAGERILLDYITAGDLVGPNQGIASRPGDPNRPTVRFSPGCSAVGMGLQIGLPPLESRDIIEASLWLVRTLADGSERSVRQNVRVRAGTTTEFFFDDEQIVLSIPRESSQPGPPVERRVRTFGSLRPIGLVSNGKIIMELVLAQQMAEPYPTDRVTGGSTTYELSAGPEEVVAFRVPQVSDSAGRLGERLSVRIQVKALNQSSGTLAQSKPTAAGPTDSAFITGEVRKPGPYPWVKGMTVLQLIALAGGLEPTADRNVMIVSATAKDAKGQPLTYVVDVDDIIKGKNLPKNFVELQPSDTVIVRRAKGLTADELRARLSAELKK